MNSSQVQHVLEIRKNRHYWQAKPILQKIYQDFYRMIAQHVNRDIEGRIVEIGSGIGNLKSVLPDCLCTDLFRNPWVDQLENAYALSFEKNVVSHLILFDVFHHLEYPGTALQELHRVLCPGGRMIIFDPALSLLSLLVYGIFHHEPLALHKKITWFAPPGFVPEKAGYYAAQGNAFRIFCFKHYRELLRGWHCVAIQKIAAISYIATGGYSKPQLFPDSWIPVMRCLDRVCQVLPSLFATRMLVILEKR